jgi:hypothetical protein
VQALNPDVFVGLVVGETCEKIVAFAKEFNYSPRAFMPGLCINDPAFLASQGDDARCG